MKLTDNLKSVYATLETLEEKQGFAYQVNEILSDRTFQSVNASLSALVTKGLVSKVKKPSGEKMLTFYKVIKDLPQE
jgi:predicted transcriptional regulator